jgi:thiamine kinase-like enzyme
MPDLNAIVDRLQSTLGPAEGLPEPLEGGITNRNFRVSFGGTDYVLRLPGKDTALLGISREAERTANAAAAELGIAPVLAAGDDSCLVTRYVQSTPVDADQLRAAPEQVGRALRKFHDSGAELPVKFWVPDLLDDYAAIVHEHGGQVPPSYGPTQELARRIADVLPLSEPVPCHDDLLAANLLTVGDAVMLVDWEYAGMGHRYFDLGNLAVNNEFDDAADERLLGAYLDRQPTPGNVAALKLMRLMSDAREAAWGVIQGVISELDFDFGAYAEKHFVRLLEAARNPRLQEWMDAASP